MKSLYLPGTIPSYYKYLDESLVPLKDELEKLSTSDLINQVLKKQLILLSIKSHCDHCDSDQMYEISNAIINIAKTLNTAMIFSSNED